MCWRGLCGVCPSSFYLSLTLSHPFSAFSYSWQAFYYPWYASLSHDGEWRHWAENLRPGGGNFDPTHNDLPSHFYPRLGAYSSASTETIANHMGWIRRAGIGTIIVSWWGRGSYEDKLMWTILNMADDYGIKVGFYIEPYGGGYVGAGGTRTPWTVLSDVQYIINTYGCHRALYRRRGRPVFMFFAARTYNNGAQDEWKQVWTKLHADPVYNPIAIAHDTNLPNRIIAGGWDGGHDYGTGEALTISQYWNTLASSFAAAGKLFYFTVSPGYDKSRLRGNTDPIISRNKGQLYTTFWKRAMAAKKNSNPVIISTFNEVSPWASE
jgi:glycoprotein endo-alpha-1,2-mannosidase